MQKTSIKSLNIADIQAFLEKSGQPKFRYKQLIEWIYDKRAGEFSEMTNLPKSLMKSISDSFVIDVPSIHYKAKDQDGTIKYVLKYSTVAEDVASQDIFVECVLIPSLQKSSNHATLCISSQAGCPMACLFCATGHQGLTRSLYMGEIIDQIICVSNDSNFTISNIVVMGQGEPFLNQANLFDALSIINEAKSINIGARKITISTCGVFSGISNLASIDKQYTLAVSLHSAIQETRDKLMPGVVQYKLVELKRVLQDYVSKTNRRPSFEYAMIDGINDTDEHLRALIAYISDLHCHINLIPLNNCPDESLRASSERTIKKWMSEIRASGTEVTLRKSKGPDINAACGQLLNSLNN